LAPLSELETNSIRALFFNSLTVVISVIYQDIMNISWVLYDICMNNSKVINVDESSPEFLLDLERRIKLAKNPKNYIPLSTAKKDILKKYQELVGAKI
jgi:hypothetical protein